MAIVGVRKVPIGALAPDITNSLIIGVIIGIQNSKKIIGKDNEQRAVLNFTLRDSPTDCINGSIWGSLAYIQKVSDIFTIGDVVEISHAKVSFVQPGNNSANYSPAVSSPFQIQLQENKSEILPHAEDDSDLIQNLMHIPIKPASDFLRLSDVKNYGEAMTGEMVNLLVAVKRVSDVRKVKSKSDDTDLMCRDITVMDQSTLDFNITLWNDGLIGRAEYWKPRYTILFLADVKLTWNTYRKSITASVTSKTIITEDPNISEAVELRNYSKTVPIKSFAILDHYTRNIPDPMTIKSVMTTAQVIDKSSPNNTSAQFTALLYVMITHLNLDGHEKIISSRCVSCGLMMEVTDTCCTNSDCNVNNGATSTDIVFNIRVSLTDHRGTLQNCHLVSPAAEKILGVTVEEFQQMSLDKKTELKWRLLLSRCEVRLLIVNMNSQPLMSVLTCSIADPALVSAKLPFY